MSELTKKKVTTKTTEKSEIQNTDLWLNVKTPVGTIGIRLADGINQHEPFLALIRKHGVEKFSKWIATKELEMYAVQEGVKSQSDISKFDEEFEAL